jgi:hypothetical protein
LGRRLGGGWEGVQGRLWGTYGSSEGWYGCVEGESMRVRGRNGSTNDSKIGARVADIGG